MIKNINTKATIFGLVSIVLVNILIGLRIYYSKEWYHLYNVSYFAFTYQDCGFISRGLLSSFFKLVGITKIYQLYIFFNIIIFLYYYLFAQIILKSTITNKIALLVLILFSFFGIVHISFDIFRTDILIELITLIIYILLLRKQNNTSYFIVFISLFIHEAIFFLAIPVILLLTENKQKAILISICFSFIFVLICYLSPRISPEKCVELICNYANINTVNYDIYASRTLSAIDNAKFNYSTYNLALPIVVSIIYSIIALIVFWHLLIKKIYSFNFMFLFPLLICFIAIDFYRWICFIYFLGILFSIKANIVPKKSIIIIYAITLLFGIPLFYILKFSPFMYLIKHIL